MLVARDPRFDGRFFFGVASTGVYCRPICPSRTPRRDRVGFFPTAAAAERAGFRPCLRCRPELAPGAGRDAAAGLAQAAAAAIEAGALGEGGLTALAVRLGVCDRHLRRVFATHFGVSPIEWAQTQRLLLAKRLLTDTPMPMLEVALASGFGSLRRFNDAFARRYRMAPGALRRELRAPAATSRRDAAPGLTLRLAYRPPLDWPALAAFLARRRIAGVEAVADVVRRGAPVRPSYRRVLRVAARGVERTGWIEVAPAPARARSGGELELRVDPGLGGAIPEVLARVRQAFDLDCRPDEVAAGLGELAAGHEGIRLPGAFDGFETGVRAVLGQQVTVRQAHALAGRFAAAFGEPVDTPWPDVDRAFPSAASVAGSDPARIASLGITRQRAATVVALARAIADGSLVLGPAADPEATIARLRALPGIGDWTAQYVAMRALAWPDAFPASDVGVMKALGVSTPRQALEAAGRWRPWRSYAVIHLWRSLASSPSPSQESGR